MGTLAILTENETAEVAPMGGIMSETEAAARAALMVARQLAPANFCYPLDVCESHRPEWLQSIRGGSARATYEKTAGYYLGFCRARGLDMNQGSINEFLQDLAAHGKTSKTIALYLAGVRSLSKFLHLKTGGPDITEGVKAPKTAPGIAREYVRPGDLANLRITAASNGRHEVERARNYAIYALAVGCGLRTIEINRLSIGDIMDGSLRVWGKARDFAADVVRLPPKVADAVNAYVDMARAGAGPDEPLFVASINGGKSGRLSTRTISGALKRALKIAGLDSRAYTAHSLRHTAVMNALKAGASIEELQQFARHRNVATTMIYVHKDAAEENPAALYAAGAAL